MMAQNVLLVTCNSAVLRVPETERTCASPHLGCVPPWHREGFFVASCSGSGSGPDTSYPRILRYSAHAFRSTMNLNDWMRLALPGRASIIVNPGHYLSKQPPGAARNQSGRRSHPSTIDLWTKMKKRAVKEQAKRGSNARAHCSPSAACRNARLEALVSLFAVSVPSLRPRVEGFVSAAVPGSSRLVDITHRQRLYSN